MYRYQKVVNIFDHDKFCWGKFDGPVNILNHKNYQYVNCNYDG